MRKLFGGRMLVIYTIVCLLVAMPSVGLAKQYDLGGNTVYFVLHGGLVDAFNAPEMLDRRAEVEAQFNAKIEVYEISSDQNAETLLRRTLSGEAAYDIYRLGSGEIISLVGQDSILPLNGHFPEQYLEDLANITHQAIEAIEIDDKTYGFMGGNLDAIDQLVYLAYNKSMFEAEGLPDPYELYKEGKWDWDAFTDVARSLTADLNGDGSIDRWAYDILKAYGVVLSNDGRWAREVDGTVVYTADETQVVEAFTKLDEWKPYGKGYGPEAFGDQTVAMLYMEQWQLREHLNPSTGAWDIDFDFGIVPMPKGDSATDNVFPLKANYYSLSSIAAQPEELIALVDALYPVSELTAAAEATFTEWSPNQESYQVLVDSIQLFAGEMDPYYKFISGHDWGTMKRGDLTWSAYLSSIKPEKQGVLDDILNQ